MIQPVPLVYYHGSCPDGTTAAWVAWKYFKGRVECVPLTYGAPFKAPEGLPRPVFMLDFCLKKNSEMKALEQFAKPYKFVVIDHHDDGNVRTSLEGIENAVYVVGKSGARLTWEYFFPEKSAPRIVTYTEDRDLWLWKCDGSQEVNAWLSSFPLNDPEEWDCPAAQLNHCSQHALPEIVEQGRVVLRFQEQCFQRAVCLSRLYTVPLPDGRVVRVRGANVSERAFGSEVASRLAGDNPLGFTWYVREDGLYVFSLRRQVEDGPHLGDVAKYLSETIPGGRSGGGHPKAAGCEFDRLPIFLLGGYNETTTV